MKRIYLLLFILIILLLISVYIIFLGRPGLFRSSENDFAIKDTARIRLVEIRSSDQIIILEKLDGQWMINRRFPASTSRIKGLLTLISRLSINALAPGSISNEIKSELENEGKRLMILTNRRNPHVIFMYHDTVYTNATYMMKEHSSYIYRVEVPGFRNRDLAGLFVDKINYWRDHSLFHLKPEEIRSVSVFDRQKPENSFYLIHSGPGEYQLLTNPDSLDVPDPDIESIERYLGYFASVSFERFLSSRDHDSTFSLSYMEPDQILTVRDSRDHITQVKTYRRLVVNSRGGMEPDFNRLFAVINNADTTLIKYIDLDPVMKEIGYFLDHEKK